VGRNPYLYGCLPTAGPFGSFDVAEGRVGGAARVAGWTVDSDAKTVPTDVHVYVDGPAGSGARGVNLGAADVARPDVPRVHAGVADNHGFDKVINGLAPEVDTLWVYAINRAGGGDNPLLRALQVQVPDSPGLGNTPQTPGERGFSPTLDDLPVSPSAAHRDASRHAGSLGAGYALASPSPPPRLSPFG
jgi:hypothetical protein